MAFSKSEVLQGTLDLLVLKTLHSMGPMHGFGIAMRIQQISEDLLRLNQGTLYPALLRLAKKLLRDVVKALKRLGGADDELNRQTDAARSAAPRAARLDRPQVGCLGKQPQGQVLLYDSRRTQTACGGSGKLGSHVRHDRPGTEDELADA